MTPGQGSPGQNSGIHEKYGSWCKNEHTMVHACSCTLLLKPNMQIRQGHTYFSCEIGVKIDCPIIVRRFQFFSLGARGLPFSLSPAPESLISSFNWLIMGISDISDACGS